MKVTKEYLRNLIKEHIVETRVKEHIVEARIKWGEGYKKAPRDEEKFNHYFKNVSEKEVQNEFEKIFGSSKESEAYKFVTYKNPQEPDEKKRRQRHPEDIRKYKADLIARTAERTDAEEIRSIEIQRSKQAASAERKAGQAANMSQARRPVKYGSSKGPF